MAQDSANIINSDKIRIATYARMAQESANTINGDKILGKNGPRERKLCKWRQKSALQLK